MADHSLTAELDYEQPWIGKRQVVDRLKRAYGMIETVGEEAFDRAFDYSVRLGEPGTKPYTAMYASFDDALDSWTEPTGHFNVPTFNLYDLEAWIADADEDVQVVCSVAVRNGRNVIEAEVAADDVDDEELGRYVKCLEGAGFEEGGLWWWPF